MTHRNPVEPDLRAILSDQDVLMLDALEAAWRILEAASEALRIRGAHARADDLDAFTVMLQEHAEHVAEEVLSGVSEEPLEGGELELSGREIEAESLEEGLAIVYADWIEYLETGDSSRFRVPDDQRTLAEILRHVAMPTRKVTDWQLIEAARDAYDQRVGRGSRRK